MPDARHSVVNFHGCQAPKVWVLTHALSFYIFVLTCTVSFGIPSRSTLTFSLSASALVIAIRCCLAHKLWNEIKRKDAWRSEMFCLYVFEISVQKFWFNLFMSSFSRNITASMSMSSDIKQRKNLLPEQSSIRSQLGLHWHCPKSLHMPWLWQSSIDVQV